VHALVTVFVILSSFYARADIPSFTAWEDLKSDQQASLSLIRKATFAFDMAGNVCSGTFISNTGHLITADHCRIACAQGNEANMRWHTMPDANGTNVFDESTYEKIVASTGVDRSFVTQKDEIVLQGTQCKANINGKEVNLTYVGGGQGALLPFFLKDLKATELTPEWTEFVSNGYGPGGDFAVFKADIESSPCLQLSTISARPGEHLRVLSAPALKGYTYENERKGQTAFFSEGAESSALRAARRPDLPLTVFRHAELAAETGSSGSGIIGEDGTIKGVLVQAQSSSKMGQTVDFSSSYIDVTFIRKTLLTNWNFDIPKCKN
jgi:hypothetical protein